MVNSSTADSLDVKIVKHGLTLCFKQNGVEITQHFELTGDTDPFKLIEFIDRLTFSIAAIGATNVNQTIERNQEGLYRVTCDNCGKPDLVSFKPKPNKPVLCNDCYGSVARKRG